MRLLLPRPPGESRTARRRPRVGAALALAMALPLLGACLAEPMEPGAPSLRSSLPVAPRLVGTWTVTGVPEPDEGAVLLFDGYRLAVWRDCGIHDYGTIVGPAGALRTALEGGAGSCDLDAGLPWLQDAERVEADGDNLILRAPDGAALATLEPGGTPRVPDSVDPSLAEPPVLTADLEEKLAAPALILPEGLVAPTVEQLIADAWYPAVHDAAAPEGSWVRFAADGTWEGSDGCNGQGSVWLLEPSGWFRSAGFAQTEIGCPGVAVGQQLLTAVALALDGSGALVALDADGEETGRFVTDLADSVPGEPRRE